MKQEWEHRMLNRVMMRKTNEKQSSLRGSRRGSDKALLSSMPHPLLDAQQPRGFRMAVYFEFGQTPKSPRYTDYPYLFIVHKHHGFLDLQIHIGALPFANTSAIRKRR
jgi:hypothetical protein